LLLFSPVLAGNALKTEEYMSFDGLGLAELVANREVSVDELTSCAVALIEEKNPGLNAVISRLEGQPYAENQPFTGVPFLVKELGLLAEGGMCRAGSRATLAIPAPADSNLMRRFRSAGLHLLGTTQTPEMGYNATTETVAFGPVHNPWQKGLSAGGSSGGSGAAVAAGFVPIAHANDGGGSIRVPASCNGLVGLKPTRDRTPTGPGSSDPLFSQAIEFVVSRSVRDSAALLDCVAGPDLGAAHIIAHPPISFAQAAAIPPGKLKIGVLQGSMLGTPIHAENSAAVDNASKHLVGLGHELVECDYRLDFEEFSEHINVFWCAFAAQFVDQVTRATGCRADNDHFEAVTLTCAEFGFNTSALQILNAQDYVNRISRATAAVFEGFDCLMSATLASPPPLHGALNQNDATISAMDWTRNTFRYATNTPLFNATGQPAISLPLHWTADDLPVGVQFAAKMGEEGLLLSLASQLEEDFDWQRKQQSLWS
jgi:amidase